MSSNFAHIKNKLKRGGLSRPERENSALPPESVAIDGRQTEDMLQFIYAFARQVNYYQGDAVNPESDWLPFFQKSIPFQYATIATFDLEALEQQYQQLADSIESRLTFASLNPLFDLLFALSDQIARWRKDVEQDEAGLKTTIDSLIETNLRTWASQLLGLANSGTKWGYRSPGFNQRQQEVFFGQSAIIRELFAVDSRIIVLRGSTKHRVLAAKDILEEIYRVFWKSIEAIVLSAQDPARLEQSLHTALGNHLPHLGLLFSFIKLFEKVQGSLNNLSTAHLDFFYRKTLQLKELPHQRDQAHVIFELGKQVEEAILIEKGQRFKAGKDDNGEEVFFSLSEDTVVTKATVAELKTLFIDQGGDPSTIPGSLQGVYAAPIADSADGLGEAFAKDSPGSWSTVGSKESKAPDLDLQPAVIKDHPTAQLGFVIASKVLFLREGKRTIDLKIKLDNDCLANYDQEQIVETIDGITTEISPVRPPLKLFKLYLSTEEGWTLIDDVDTPLWTIDDTREYLETQIILENDFLPVIYPGKEVLVEDYGHQLPMIKAEFNQEIAKHLDGVSSWYWELRQQTITEVCVDVKVCDVRQLVLQNDFAVLDPNKPFQPFGPLPKKNSSKFYIGSEEIFCKNWEQIDINVEWKDLPTNLEEYYAGYDSIPEVDELPANDEIKVDIDVLANYKWEPLATNNKLFVPVPVEDPPNNICTNGSPPYLFSLNNTLAEDSITCKINEDISNGYTNNLPCGFLRFELNSPDFLHEWYGKVLTEQIIRIENNEEIVIDQAKLDSLISNIETLEIDLNTVNNIPTFFGDLVAVDEDDIDNLEAQSNAILTEINNLNNDIVAVSIPNPPYTPLIEKLSLNYTASDTTSDAAHFTHLHPWTGTHEHLPLDGVQAPQHGNTLLPCFLDEGTLYIGLNDYQPGSLLPLYFELEPSTAEPDLDKAIVCWEYLRGNTWFPLQQDSEVLSDTTNGLIQPGIVTIAIPAAIAKEGTTIMPADKHWIRARVLLRSKAIAETLLVSAQSAVLDFAEDDNNDLQRLDNDLAAGTISKPLGVVTGLKGASQPYPAFGGRSPEATADFNLRISEHLRHKGRAITISDYERLVLAEFPQVYRVRCLNHTLGRRGQTSDFEMCPGFVTLVVIPDLKVVNASDIFEPRLPAADLQAIKTFLQDKISPFIHLEVLNPIYQPVKIRAEVQFIAGKSENFYKKQLEKDLQVFLAPWSGEDDAVDISFGGSIFYSSALHFIEKLKYIENVFRLTLLETEPVTEVEIELEVITATEARSVLTTSDVHDLQAISSASEGLDNRRGVGYDRILR